MNIYKTIEQKGNLYEARRLEGLDYTRVRLPQNLQPREEMIEAMLSSAQDGHTIFGTQTNECLNHTESPDGDIHPSKDKWVSISFFHDCKPEEVGTGSYLDITLFRKS